MPSRLEIAVDIASITRLFVSTAGPWYSVKAWRRTTAAEQVATEAREAVRRGNAAYELRPLASLASELLACVQNGQGEAAAVRGRDLLSGINQARMRWRTYFPSPEVEQRLDETGRDVEKSRRHSAFEKAG